MMIEMNFNLIQIAESHNKIYWNIYDL